MAFYQDEVKQRGRDLDAQIALENQEMELSAQQLHDRVRKQFQAAFLAMEQKTLSHFARLEVNEVATEERKSVALLLLMPMVLAN